MLNNGKLQIGKKMSIIVSWVIMFAQSIILYFKNM